GQLFFEARRNGPGTAALTGYADNRCCRPLRRAAQSRVGMFTQERQQLILSLLSDQGRLTVSELAARLDVSDDTVRRDLRALSNRGFLQKVHGGAVALDVPRMDRLPRTQLMADVKVRLGAAVISRIESGQTIMLDAGHTTLEVARSLPQLPLTVITHALDIAQCLSEHPTVKLILAGGEWDPRERLFCGTATPRMVCMYRSAISILIAWDTHT